MPGKAYLFVRSVVPDEGDRAGFDHWYATDHMPKAIAVLGAERGWRFWSRTDPAIHCAVYRYADMATLSARDGEGRARLMREYEETWPGVTRTREAFEMMEDEHVAGAAAGLS